MADRDFSTLEAVNLGYQPLRNHETLTADLGKQVVTDNAGKEVIKPYSDGIEPTSNQQDSTATKDYHEPLVDEQQHPKRSRKWWWIGGVILLLMILGAVLGGVLGTRKSSKSSSSTPVSNSTTPSNATLVYNIAALALESGTVENTRVYYQDNAGMLIEAAQSNSNPWEFTKIELLQKKNSTLAATVSRPGFPMEISVFYTDNNDEVHDIIYNSTSRKWSQGILFQKHYKAYPNSTMSAMYHQCRLCSNTKIMTFQDVNGIVLMAKFQDSQWTTRQLDVDPVPGTGFALHPSYEANKADKIMFYHQKRNLSIGLASYDRVWDSNPSIEIYNTAPNGTPIAAASSYTNVTAGYETWRHMLKLSKEGVQVSTWLGSQNGWFRSDHKYTAFANATETNFKTYGSLAVTAIGRAFAVVEQPPGNFSIQSYRMSDGLKAWMITETVATWN